MSTFDFLSVLFSVIIGLALTQILQGFRSLMLARQRVVLYWPGLVWAALLVVVLAQAWWGMFEMRAFREWTFAMYAMVVLQITLMYLTAGLAIPDIPAEGVFDMRAAYFANRQWFFGLLALTVLATFIKDLVTIGRISSGWNAYFLEFNFLLFVTAAVTKSRWFHWCLAPFCVVVITLYTAFLSFRL